MIWSIKSPPISSRRTAAPPITRPQPLTTLEMQIGKINFYRTKARSIHNCCHHLVDRFAGKVPDNLADLLSLPGVGRKTANIVLGNAYGRQTIGVDTHVSRLSQRLGFTKQVDPDKIEADLMEIVPRSSGCVFAICCSITAGACAWQKNPIVPPAVSVSSVRFRTKRNPLSTRPRHRSGAGNNAGQKSR